MKWQVKQKIKRIAALLLSFVLLFDALEISAPAPVVRAMEESFGAFCAVTAFAELPQELREQTLPLGAQESEIELPGSLSVTANVLETLPSGTAPAQTENAAQGTVPTTPIAEIPEEEEVLDADAEPQIQIQPQTAPAAAAQENVSLTLDGVEEVPYVQNTIRLDGVQWRIDAKRSAAESFLADEEHAGASYTYVAVLPKKDSAGNTVVLQEGAQLPEIHVTVEGEKDAEAEKETERVTGTESKTETEPESEKLTEAGETETEEITEKAETETESETETETETEIETEEETDAEKEAGSDLAVENEEEAETETETETEMIIEAEDETESETEEQEVSLMTIDEPMMMLLEDDGDGDGTGSDPIYNTDGSINLKPFITDVEFTWEDGNGIRRPIEKNADGNYEFPSNGTKIGFKLRYRMPKGIVTPQKNVVKYKLPDGFSYDDVESGNIVWGSGIAGTYTIENGEVTLTFDENSGFFASDTDFTGYVSFEGSVNGTQGDGSHNLKFKEDVEFTYTITERQEEESTGTDNSFNAQKSSTWLDNDILRYTIDVTAGNMGASNVTLKDWMSAQVNGGSAVSKFNFRNVEVKAATGEKLTLLEDYGKDVYTEVIGSQIPIDGKSGEYITTVLYQKDGRTYYKEIRTGSEWYWTTVTVPEPGYYIMQEQSDGTHIFILPDLDPGEKCTITYDVDVWEDLRANGVSYNSTWDSYNIKNSITDYYNQYRDGNEQSRTNTWIKKYTQGEVKLNSEGKYEIGWKVEINPDHLDLPLDANFLDKLNLSGEIIPENYNLKITVTRRNESYQDEEVHIDSDKVTPELLAKLLSDSNPMSIGDILQELGVQADGTDTTNYAISFTYTTLVEAAKLPDGLTTVDNTGELSKNGSGPSSKASVGLQNVSLEKKADETNVKLSDETDGAPKDVLLIPWKATVKMNELAADGTLTYASIIDTFDSPLWVTGQYLKDHLKMYFTKLDGSQDGPVRDSYYKLYGTKEDGTEAPIENLTGDEKLTGFKVEFQPGAYEYVAGRTLQLDYTLFGDTSFLHDEGQIAAGNQPKQTYTNHVSYGNKTDVAEYEAKGDFFDKESSVNSGYWLSNREAVSWKDLPDHRIKWRLKVELSEFTRGKDITITDVFPKELELYSIDVTRDYGNAGRTDILTEFKEQDYELELYNMEWDGKKPISDKKIKVNLSKNAEGNIVITVTIPKELIETGNKSHFYLNVEANIPADSDLMDLQKENVTKQIFKNSGTLKVADEVRGQDTDEVTVTNDKSALKKNGFLADSSNIIHYTLEANPGGLPRSDGNPLELTDKLEYCPDVDASLREQYLVDLVPSSVKAYYYRDGQKVYLPADGYDFSYTYEVVDGMDASGNRNRQNILRMQIPDALPVYIEYDYELSSKQVEIPWSIHNSASLKGVAGATASDDKQVKFSQSMAVVEKNFVDFYKVDMDNYNIALPGAEFVLYIWKPCDVDGNMNRDAAKAAEGEKPEQYKYTEGDNGYWEAYTEDGKVKSFVSDSDGMIPVKDSVTMQAGTLYWLKETKAPAGYTLQENNGYYFYLAGTITPDRPASLGSKEVHELSGANTIYIPNEPSSTGSITARKIWANDTKPVDVQLTLYKGYARGYTYEDTKPGTDGQPKLTMVEAGVENPKTISAAASSEGEWTVTWDNLPQKDNNEGRQIYYYVFETRVDNKGDIVVLEDGSFFIDKYSVEYGNNIGLKSGTVTIANSTTSISVKKVWADAEDHSKDDISVKLYQSFTPPMSKEEAAKPKKIGFNLRSKEEIYWNRDQVVYEKDGVSMTYADDYGFKDDVTSDTVKIELILNIANSAFTKDSVKYLCDDEKVVLKLVDITKLNEQQNQYKLVWEASNITSATEVYIYIDETVYAEYEQNKGVTITNLEPKGTGPQHPDDLQLAELPDGESAQVTLNNDCQWSHKWENLPAVVEDSGGNLRRVYYYVEEEYFDGYASTYKYEYNSDGTIFRGVTITNSLEDETKTSVSVEKKWVNSSDKLMKPGDDWQVKVQLQRLDGGKREPYSGEDAIVTLSEKYGWTYTWKDLPLGEYCVQEIEGKEGFTVSYESKSTTEPQNAEDYQNAAVSRGKITVTNKAPEKQITVKKEWEGGRIGGPVKMQLFQSKTPPVQEPTMTRVMIGVGKDSWLTEDENPGSAPSSGEITVKIYECDASGIYDENADLVDTVYLNHENDWKNTTKELPGVTWDLEGNETVHYYKAVYSGDGEFITEVVEREGGKESALLSGEKAEHELQLQATMSATAGAKHVSLYIGINYPYGTYIDPKFDTIVCENDIEGNEAIIKIEYDQYTYKGLPKLDSGVIKIDKPDGVDLYEYDPIDDGGFYLKYKISWLPSFDKDEIEIRFYFNYSSDGYGWPKGKADGARNSIEPLPANTVSYTSSSRKRMSNHSAINAGPSVIGLNKPSDAEPVIGADGKEMIVTLDGEGTNGWEYTWEHLPQYDDEGNKLYYYVEEVSDPDQKIVSTTYSYEPWDKDKPWEGIKIVTVTNTLPTTLEPKKTSVTVKKNWVGYDDSSGETNGYVVQVQLQQRQRTVNEGFVGNWGAWSNYKSQELTQSVDDWSHTWSGLDWKVFTDTNSYTEYDYQVMEVKVFGPPDSEPTGEPVVINNFTSATSWDRQGDGSYTFTITNTKKQQGIIIPSTGSKYPWIFYGIGTTFLLIALAWMSRALKKSCIPSDTGKGGRQSDE